MTSLEDSNFDHVVTFNQRSWK